VEVSDPPRPEVYLSRQERAWAAAWLAEHVPARRKVCVLSPRAVTTAGCYDGADWDQISRALQEEYAVGAPINPKTGKAYGRDTRAYNEWEEAQGKPAISPDELELMTAMRESVENHDLACALLSSGQAEGVLRGEWKGVACQARLDWFCDAGIVDLKTCEDLDRFERQSRDFGYPEQVGGFYHGFARHLDLKPAAAAIIAVEKRPPYRVGVWRFSEASISALVERTESDLRAGAAAFEADTWRTRYEEARWM
jgi:hypothetical protein